MNDILKKTSEIDKNELGKLYDICYNNLSSKIINNPNYAEFSTSEYKDKWIDEISLKDNAFCLEFYEEMKLVGFIIFYLEENENFVRQFQIIKDYQGDGKTFRKMIELFLPHTNKENLYTGIIFDENNQAQKAFKSLGTNIVNGKYQVSYNIIMKSFELKDNKINKE